MSYSSLIPLIEKTKSPLNPEQFQEKVNIIFHNIEADYYDNNHQNMWNSLQEQIDLLIKDLFDKTEVDKELKMLDIGCGTGLSTHMLLQSKLGENIGNIMLLDTSQKMLEKAVLKAAKWDKPYRIFNGYLHEINETFDVILISSVLHHIPTLDAFLEQVEQKLNSNGILIHLQDPNGDFLDNPTYLKRKYEFKNEKKRRLKKRKTLKYYIYRIYEKIKNKILGHRSFLDKINDELISQGVIVKKMSMSDVWSVTDIHVETDTHFKNTGISFQFLKKQLKNFELIGHHTYSFYGDLKSELSDDFYKNECLWISENRLDGRNISCIWKKK